MAIEDRSLGEVKPGKDFFTPAEFAKFFGVTPKTVSNWCDKGRIPFITTPSGHRRIPATAIKGGLDTVAKWDALKRKREEETKGLTEVTEEEVAD